MQKAISCSWIKSLNIIKMLIFPKLIYVFNVIQMKKKKNHIRAFYFLLTNCMTKVYQVDKLNLQIIWKENDQEYPRRSWRTKWKHLSQQATLIIMTERPRLWHLCSQVKERNTNRDPEANSCVHDKGIIVTYQKGKNCLFKWSWENRVYRGGKKLGSYFIQKSASRIKDLTLNDNINTIGCLYKVRKRVFKDTTNPKHKAD